MHRLVACVAYQSGHARKGHYAYKTKFPSLEDPVKFIDTFQNHEKLLTVREFYVQQ